MSDPGRLFWSLAILTLVGGCDSNPGPAPPRPKIDFSGPDSVTPKTLAGSEFVDISDDTHKWIFHDSEFHLEGAPIPPDLSKHIGFEGPVKSATGLWRIDEAAESLVLSEITGDGKAIEGVVRIPLTPAGHVRVNIGARQYNGFPPPWQK